MRKYKRLFLIFILFLSAIALGNVSKSDTKGGEVEKLISTGNYNGPYIISENELKDNLYKIELFKEVSDGKYSVYYINLPTVDNMSIKELISFINSKDYSDINTETGVNCKWVTSCAVEWAKANNIKYEIKYSSSHVKALLYYNNDIIDFDWGEYSKVRVISQEEA